MNRVPGVDILLPFLVRRNYPYNTPKLLKYVHFVSIVTDLMSIVVYTTEKIITKENGLTVEY